MFLTYLSCFSFSRALPRTHAHTWLTIHTLHLSTLNDILTFFGFPKYFFFRLWCICQTPHNNRFMICCDKCLEWFHGKCVGITKSIGKDIEQRGSEWICPKCKKKQQPSIQVCIASIFSVAWRFSLARTCFDLIDSSPVMPLKIFTFIRVYTAMYRYRSSYTDNNSRLIKWLIHIYRYSI